VKSTPAQPRACISTVSINIYDNVQIWYTSQIEVLASLSTLHPVSTENKGGVNYPQVFSEETRTHYQHEVFGCVCGLYQPTYCRSSVPVAIYVPPPILRGARYAATTPIGIGTIDKSNTVTRLRRGPVAFRTAKPKKNGTRAVRSVARL